ncbi:YheC/YheD family protein [Cytobacillus oceanisediminis]|uniref:YheC/YheD family endospore coat-associated protein n=1 Tax=Cytobacillus oceanisediminis TaxID=665099 RepID=UPI0020412D1E|nr:YheC/YheD family protein [Cytobacillus oceanisediminis]MCM3241228.1 YheC/YheD family protein [Cytobacillus oceanisediminis]MCM3404150.1 YheC/YheD family protein [Cytobacillus oceanisediminis]MDK7667904.1 YheC/YheD family protein [Cytobacillus oceanisediminis]
MLSFGIMTLNKRSEQPYFMELARRANEYNINCFRFVPSDINPITERITGDFYNPASDGWEPAEFTAPEILYDRCFYGNDSHSKQCISIVNWLKARSDIQFLGYGLPNKLELYEILSCTNISPYLLKTAPYTDADRFLDSLLPDHPLILKPASGSQGHGIYYIEKTGKNILVKTDKKNAQVSRSFESAEKAAGWLNNLTAKRQYLFQPYVNLSNKEEQPFDIRILLQKDMNGTWKELGRGIRAGRNGGIVSNLSTGGSNISFEDWIIEYPSSLRSFLCDELYDIIDTLPAALERKLPPLFEIGIDIGVENNGSIWILDINSKPGRKTILNSQPEKKEELYTAPLHYAKFLAANKELERSTNHEKTISN